MNRGISYFVKSISNKYLFVLLDVGAMEGVPLKKWRNILPVMQIIGFEPDLREFCKLEKNNNLTYLNYALYSESEGLTFYITKGYGKSSIFRPNMNILSQYEDCERFEIVREEVIPLTRVKTLDAVIYENSILDVDFLKIDTQGSELFILKGGQAEVIPKVFAIQMEVEFIEIYEKQPLFRDVYGFMESKGFQLIDLRRVYWKRKDYYNYIGKGELIFGDALYFKRIDVFRNELLNVNDNMRNRSKILKSIFICITYRIFDYAVSIAKLGLELGYLINDDYNEIVLYIKDIAREKLFSGFHMSSRLYDIGNIILQKFKPRSYLGWADADNEIGNINATD